MAAFTGNGYLVADITTLLAIPSSDRPAFRVALLVQGIGWYEYDNTATTGGLTPTDSPATGRWFAIAPESLRSDRTYYVRTDGSDNNNGLTNTSGGAFATIAKFYSTITGLTLNGFTVTCQLASGTYVLSSTINSKSPVGSGFVIITGATTTASDCVLQSTNITLLNLVGDRNTTIQNLTFSELGASSYLSCIFANNAFFKLKNVVFSLTSNAVGLNAVNSCFIEGEALSFIGSGYVNIACANSLFNYKRISSIDFSSSLAYVAIQGNTSVFDFFNVDFNGSGTKNYNLSQYSVITMKTGKTISGTASDSIITIIN